MNTTSRPTKSPSAAAAMPWLLNLAIRLTARALNMPEPLVHTTGVFVFAQVQAVETSVGRALCPVRLWRAVQEWRGRMNPTEPSRKSVMYSAAESPRRTPHHDEPRSGGAM